METDVYIETDVDSEVELTLDLLGPAEAQWRDEFRMWQHRVDSNQRRTKVMSVGRGAKFSRDDGIDFELGLHIGGRFIVALHVFIAPQVVSSDMYVSWRTADDRIHPFIMPDGTATEYLPRLDTFRVGATLYSLHVEKLETRGADDILINISGHANEYERRFYEGKRMSADEAQRIADEVRSLMRAGKSKEAITREAVKVPPDALVHIDAWGEGRWTDSTPAVFRDGIINLNKFEYGSDWSESWWPIPRLVKLDDFKSDWPFAKGFADRVTVRGSPIDRSQNQTITELPRILRRPGAVQLYLVGDNTREIEEMMKEIRNRVGGSVTKYEVEPPDIIAGMTYTYIFVE